jgi:DNA-directed RNA polymerase
MDRFTGWQYLLIDAANQAGLDKKEYAERLTWAEQNLDTLEFAVDQVKAKTRPLYLKAVQAIRKAQAGKPTGHLVAFDAVCSGMQIASVLTGCMQGGKATGLVDPNKRANAYAEVEQTMVSLLGYDVNVLAKQVKLAVMATLYGSKKEPKKAFGDGSEAHLAFQQALFSVAPGACRLLEVLRGSWQPYALTHEWTLPDGGHVVVKVMDKVKKRIEVDELAKATFTYEYKENVGKEKGLSNIANVIHSVDAYILRCLIRRCNYDPVRSKFAYNCIQDELVDRAMGADPIEPEITPEIAYYQEQYQRSGIPDIVIVPYITREAVLGLSDNHLRGLSKTLESMIFEHKPFEVITVHDDFKCHANNVNHLRSHYREILAELAESNLLDDLLTQLYGFPSKFTKLSNKLPAAIRQSNYALS